MSSSAHQDDEEEAVGALDGYEAWEGNSLDSDIEDVEEFDILNMESGAKQVLENVPRPKRVEMVCRFFLKGICSFGEECRFSHDISDGNEQGIDKIEECLTYSKTGQCPYNENCWFLHVYKPQTDPARSDGLCSVCFEDVTANKRKFALLPNCDHTFCMDCMKGWRDTSSSMAGKMKCPACRSAVELLVPSWEKLTGDLKEERFKLYKSVLSKRTCKFYDRETQISKCPFGPHCFYGHFDENGVDVKGHEIIKQNRKNRRTGRADNNPMLEAYDEIFEQPRVERTGFAVVVEGVLHGEDDAPEFEGVEFAPHIMEEIRNMARMRHSDSVEDYDEDYFDELVDEDDYYGQYDDFEDDYEDDDDGLYF